MTNNPAGYELDHQRVVLEKIQEDVGMFVMDMSQEVCGCRQGAFIIAAAEILVPKTTDLVAWCKSGAFTAGAITTLAAFQESDQDNKTITQMQRSLTMQSIPVNLLAETTEETLLAFEREAQKGMKAHPEIKDHLDYVSHYYTEATQDSCFGEYVFTGGGFYASRLDRCYEDIMDRNLSNWFGEEIKQIDWDAIFN